MAFLSASSSFRHWRRAGLSCLVWLWVFAGLKSRAAEPPSGEYQVKAGFIFNFAQFAEWPAKAYADARAPMVIGVLGENPFGAYLDELVKGEKVGVRPLVVRYYGRVEEAAESHILFISRSEAPQFNAIMAHLKGRPVLTIGDVEPFTRAGGMVRFEMDGGKIKLRIYLEAAKAGGIIISSKIVRPATLVTPDKN